MKELLTHMVKELVDLPEKVRVDVRSSHESKTMLLEVQTDKSDTGKVIGKQGRIAKGIRIVLEAVAARQGRRVVVEIVE
jgi:predicted RNA-binding protein YlqC (UPF0109 family)